MSEELVTLPHSGLRVPHTDLHVTAARSMPGTDGEMLNATLRLKTRVVGYLFNEGRGGATFFQPKGASFVWRDLEAFVTACRTPAGQPVPEEHVLDLLVDEHRTTRDISAAARANHTPLRLCTTWHGLIFRVGSARATLVTTAAHRDRLRADLARHEPPGDGEWWQLWPGESGWEDLTPRPAAPTT